MTDKEHERNNENERLFLGGLIQITTNNEDMPILKIQAENFSNDEHKLIFKTIFKQIENGISPDIKTLASDHDLAEVEKWYISKLTTDAITGAKIKYHESEIIKAWQTRTARDETQKFLNEINSAEYTGEIEPVILKFMERMAGAVSDTKYNRFATWEEFYNYCIKHDPSKDFKPSMFAGLRFPNGTLSYIGGRPSDGKSTILVNIAREALDAGKKVFLVNMEMTNISVTNKFALSFLYASATSKERENLHVIKDPQLSFENLLKKESDSQETFNRLGHNAAEKLISLFNTRLFLFNGAEEKLGAILATIESRINEGDIVLIDYVQRLPPPKGNNDQRYIQIKNISNALLALAMKKNAVIISGAQFGRSKETGKEATFDDFRESGDIEQDAHNAMAIESIDEKNRYIHVLKQREGGANFTRAELDCNFDYLYIAGTGREYKKKAKKVKSIPPEGTGDNFNWSKV